MPKETVVDEAGMFDIHVGWSKEWSDVQIGVGSHDGRPLAEKLTEVADDGKITQAEFRDVWGSLDRTGVNKLIRVLRHARDAAFGRDE